MVTFTASRAACHHRGKLCYRRLQNIQHISYSHAFLGDFLISQASVWSQGWRLVQITVAPMCMQGSWDMMGQQEPTGPALWSAEDPNLYILVLSLLGPDGSHVESESCQVSHRNLQPGFDHYHFQTSLLHFLSS